MVKENKNALFGNKYVNIRDSKLYVGQFTVESIAEKYDTPTFMFELNKIKKNIEQIQTCFSEVFSNSQGFYSMKANYFSPIMNLVKNNNFGAEIVGIPEFNQLIAIDFPLSNVIAGGPYLPNDFIRKLIMNKMGFIAIYDLDDMDRIQGEIEHLEITDGYIQNIIIRFQAPKYTGRQGIPLNTENIKKLSENLEKCPNLHFSGILSHMGTRMKSEENYFRNFNFVEKIIEYIQKETKLSIEVIDIGGGFPNADTLKKPFLISMLEELKRRIESLNLHNYKIFYEPGRFIVGDAGFCISKVYKYDVENKVAFVNIGNNFIPKFMKSSLRFYNASKILETPNFPIDIMGIIPSDQDILIKNYNFTHSIESGDLILIANVGAYALTWSTRFPYSLPSILFLNNSEIDIFHKREDELDFTIH